MNKAAIYHLSVYRYAVNGLRGYIGKEFVDGRLIRQVAVMALLVAG